MTESLFHIHQNLGMLIEQILNELGLDRSRLRYFIVTLLTFGSGLIYLDEAFSILGLVSFTLPRLFCRGGDE